MLILCDVRDEDDEADPDVFDELQLAKAIRYIAAQGEFYEMRRLLREIADALDHPKALQLLKLHKPRVGRSMTAAQKDIARNRERGIVAAVWREFSDFGQMESAISAARAQFSVSRATVFRALKNEAQRKAYARKLFNKLPATEDLRDLTEEAKAAYHEYENWLDRYTGAEPSKYP